MEIHYLLCISCKQEIWMFNVMKVYNDMFKQKGNSAQSRQKVTVNGI